MALKYVKNLAQQNKIAKLLNILNSCECLPFNDKSTIKYAAEKIRKPKFVMLYQ